MRKVTIPIDGYSKMNPPLSTGEAVDRMDDIDNMLIVLDQESRDARFSLFDSRDRLRKYVEERTQALATLKIERLFLKKWVLAAPEREEQQKAATELKKLENQVLDREEAAKSIASLATHTLAQANYTPRFSDENLPNSEADILTRSETLAKLKNQIIEALTEIKKISEKSSATSAYVKARNSIIPVLTAMERELQFLKHCRRVTSFWPGGMPHLDAIRFLEEIISRANGNLPLEPDEENSLAKIREWLRENSIGKPRNASQTVEQQTLQTSA